jgi:hypothetical protein
MPSTSVLSVPSPNIEEAFLDGFGPRAEQAPSW